MKEELTDKYNTNDPYHRGRVAFENGNYERAAFELNEAIKNPAGPKSTANAYYLLGRISDSNKYYNDMVKYYEKYLELEPNGQYVRQVKIRVAQFYVKEGLMRSDSNYLRKAEEYLSLVDTSNGAARMALGAIYLDEKNYEKAIQEFERSANLDPGDLKLKYNSLGLAYIKVKMYENAARVLEIAVLIDPQDKYAQNNLGYAYVQLGKYVEAKPHFEEALKIDPSYVNAKKNLQWINRQLSQKGKRASL